MSQDLTGRTLRTLMEAGLARRIQGTKNRVFGVACMAMGRRIVQVGPGLLRIEQRLGIPGIEIGTDVAGPACIYAVVQVTRGSVIYQHGEVASMR